MLKHFHLGQRVNFPAIFLVTLVLMYAVGHWLFAETSRVAFWQPKTAFELAVAVVGPVAAFVYFLYAQHHQDTQTFIKLFEKYNARYNELNEKLNAIISRSTDSPLLPAERDTLYDYFNLCAEEHLFYEAGYIDKMVWHSWLLGMKQFARSTAVRRLWEKEIATGSYYRFQLRLIDDVEFQRSSH
jgi:hypothetical protein